MLKVDSLEKGIVIDHIKAGRGYKIYQELGLHEAGYTTAFIQNVPSKKHGRKDLIKISNVVDIDLDMLGLIDPDITVTIIENDKVVDKVKLSLPKKVSGILKCKNPRCITTTENIECVDFYLVDEKKRQYKCEYCDARTSL